MWKKIFIYSVIQIFACVLTLTCQYIFTRYTYYESFTRMHGKTVEVTLALRLGFASAFGLSGCFGLYSVYKKTTLSMWMALTTAGVASCVCLVFLGESAICTTFIVTKLEENNHKEFMFYPNEYNQNINIVNLEIEIGENSNEIVLPSAKHGKLLLALFSSQLVVCLIQALVLILSCSEISENLKHTEMSYFKRVCIRPKSCYRELYTSDVNKNFHKDNSIDVIKPCKH